MWDEVDFVGEFKGVGLANGFDYSEQMSTVTELTFEWQGLGEKVGTSAVDMLTGSNGSNVFAAFGGDDVLNGSGGGDSYQFMGNFGNDKVLEYGYGVDILQIGASVENVWLERMGRRGDELKISVNDGTNVGTISVGRQFNPYSSMQAVDEIHFGFNGANSESMMTLANGNGTLDHNSNSFDINVSRNGSDFINLQADTTQGQSIYLNANEGNAVVSIAYRDTDYSGMFKEHIGIDIDYGTHEDHLEISIATVK